MIGTVSSAFLRPPFPRIGRRPLPAQREPALEGSFVGSHSIPSRVRRGNRDLERAHGRGARHRDSVQMPCRPCRLDKVTRTARASAMGRRPRPATSRHRPVCRRRHGPRPRSEHGQCTATNPTPPTARSPLSATPLALPFLPQGRRQGRRQAKWPSTRPTSRNRAFAHRSGSLRQTPFRKADVSRHRPTVGSQDRGPPAAAGEAAHAHCAMQALATAGLRETAPTSAA